MPTGYTAMLDDHPEMTTKRWVMEGLARAFGVCIDLRDDSLDLSEMEIEKRIVKAGQDGVDYHAKELGAAVKESFRLSELSPKQWGAEWQANEKIRVEKNSERTAEAAALKARHQEVSKDLLKIVSSPVAGEITKKIAQYGLDQLKMVAREEEPYIVEAETFMMFKSRRLKEVANDIGYHEKELKLAQKRAKERVTAYIALRKEVTAILTSEVTQ